VAQIEFYVRASPPSERFPNGYPEEKLSADYEPHEQDLMRRITQAVEAAPEGSEERAGLMNELYVLHEFKALFPGSRMLTAEEEIEQGYREEQSKMSIHPDQDSLFPIPERARPAQQAMNLTGKYHGRDATATERASGTAVEAEDQGSLKPGSAAHSVLSVYGGGERLTSYDASQRACEDFHARRRESTRLLTRGFLVKDGTLPNRAPGGREHVDAYRITDTGRAELGRLDQEVLA